MRRLLALAAAAALGWWLWRRRRRPAETATIGYPDGSSLTLEPGAPELEPLLRIARDAVP